MRIALVVGLLAALVVRLLAALVIGRLAALIVLPALPVVGEDGGGSGRFATATWLSELERGAS